MRPNRWILTAAILAAAAGGCAKDKGTNPGAGTVLDLPLPARGGMASFTFPAVGVFPYKCGLHPTIMRGNRVTVTEASDVTDVTVNVVGTTTPGFDPSSVTVKVGGTVRWLNPTDMAHSVVND